MKDNNCYQDWETIVLTKPKHLSKDGRKNKTSNPKSSQQIQNPREFSKMSVQGLLNYAYSNPLPHGVLDFLKN